MKDKVAVITGSTSGIGLEIAKHFAKLESKIVINGFAKETKVAKILAELKEAPSYMDAWLKTSTKNKKQLMINEAVIYSASKCHNGFCILPKILERFTQVRGI